MKRFSVAIAIAVILLNGCGGGDTASTAVDNGPTILGFTPAMRAAMREVIQEQEPAADADKVVQLYMSQLSRIATDLGVQPNAAGDLVVPPEKELQIDKSKLRAKGGVLEGIEVLQEFDVSLPGWAAPLVKEYEAGTITPRREELLITVVSAELTGVSRNLSK